MDEKKPLSDPGEMEIDNALYKKMYLKMVKAVLEAEDIIDTALKECEEIFLEADPHNVPEDCIPVIRYLRYAHDKETNEDFITL